MGEDAGRAEGDDGAAAGHRQDSFLENWSSGLHRVIFYGDHTRDLQRYCRFAQIRIVHEGTDEPQKVDGLDWDPHVHA